MSVLNEKSRIFNGIFQESEEKKDNKYIFQIFEIFQKFIEKKQDLVKSHFNQFTEILLSFRNTEILEIRAKLGKILINLFKLNFLICNKLQKEIFFFFFNNFRVENYQMNLSASEFFLFFLENKEEFIKKNFKNYKTLFSDEGILIDQKTFITDENEDSEWINLIELFEKYLKE